MSTQKTPKRIFNFTVQVGDITSYQSPDLELLLPGIRLYFLRYGLFSRQADQDVVVGDHYIPVDQQFHKTLKRDGDVLKRFSIIPENPPETPKTSSRGTRRNRRKQNASEQLVQELYPEIDLEAVDLKGIPGMPTDIHNFYTGVTRLRAGYIYLINDEDPNDYYEYEVDAAGKLNTISWDYGNGNGNIGADGQVKDIRKNEADRLLFKTLKPKSKKLWIAYSPVQWSRAYHEELNADVEKRREVMTLFDCQGITRGAETATPQLVPYTHIDTVFKANDPYQHPLKEQLDTIHANELQQQNDPEQDQELLEDLFIILHDPIGCAQDISELLNDTVIQHQASVEAMRFGEDPKDIAQRIKDKEPRTQISARAKEQSDLFTLAMTLHPLVFNDPKTIQKYANGFNGVGSVNRARARKGLPPKLGKIKPSIIQDKLTAVLGIAARKTRRAKIRSLQKDLKTYLESTYLDEALAHFLGSKVCAIWGKEIMVPHLQRIALDPHAIDGSLDLKNLKAEEKNLGSATRAFLKAKITCDTPMTKLDTLLAYNVNELTDDNMKDAFGNAVNVGNKAAAIMVAFLDATASILIDDPDFTPRTIAFLAINKINSFKIRIDDHKLIALDVIDDTALAKELNGKFLTLEEGVDTAALKKTTPKGTTRIDLNSPNIILQVEEGRLAKIGVPATDPNAKPKQIPTKNANISNGILNSYSFRSTVALLQVLNLSVAAHTIYKDPKYKSLVNLIGVTAELTEASMRVYEVYILKKTGEKISKGLALGTLRVAAVAGAGITAIMCFWDAKDSYAARDDDAAYAMAGAGVAYTIVTVATVAAIVGQSAAAGGAVASAIVSIIGSTAWAGPVGWIAAAVGIGCVGVWMLLSDTPIQKYLANCPFNNDTPLVLPEGRTLATWEHNQLFYDQRVTLLEERSGSTSLTDFTDATAALHDVLIGSQVKVKHRKVWSQASRGPMRCSSNRIGNVIAGHAEEYTIAVSFNAFLKTVDQFEYALYYYPNGVNRGGRYILLDKKEDSKVKINKKENGNPYQVTFSTSLPMEQIRTSVKSRSYSANLLLVYRLRMPNSSYYPITYDGMDRSVGIIIPIYYSNTHGTNTYTVLEDEAETKIAETSKLLDYTAWTAKK